MPLLPFKLNLAATTTRTVPLMRAPRAGRLVKATVIQELDADGDKVLSIRNATRNVAMTALADLDALAALGSVAMVPNTDGSADFAEGDNLTALYTVNTAGSVAPGETTVVLDVQYGMMNDGGVGG